MIVVSGTTYHMVGLGLLWYWFLMLSFNIPKTSCCTYTNLGLAISEAKDIQFVLAIFVLFELLFYIWTSGKQSAGPYFLIKSFLPIFIPYSKL